MDINNFAQIIEKTVPPSLQEDWDNSGWQLKLGNEIKRVLVALEVTNSVIDEAVSKEADLIITHHPLIFNPIKSLDNNDVISTQIITLVKAGISVYSTHTSFDRLIGGNNDYLGLKLGLRGIRASEADETGYLRTGVLEQNCEMNVSAFIDYASDKLGINSKFMRLSGDINAPVKKIGWCTGAGAFLIKTAADEGCDLFITGDLKYHDAQFARAIGINVLDLGHYATEKIFGENLISIFENSGEKGDVELFLSEIDINPFSL